MIIHLRRSVTLALVVLVATFAYAYLGTGVSQVLFRHQADGSITANGSTLIGQNWSDTKCPGHPLDTEKPPDPPRFWQDQPPTRPQGCPCRSPQDSRARPPRHLAGGRATGGPIRRSGSTRPLSGTTSSGADRRAGRRGIATGPTRHGPLPTMRADRDGQTQAGTVAPNGGCGHL